MTDYLLKDAFSLVRHNRFKQLNNFIDKNEIEVDEQDDKGNTMLLVACQMGINVWQKLFCVEVQI